MHGRHFNGYFSTRRLIVTCSGYFEFHGVSIGASSAVGRRLLGTLVRAERSAHGMSVTVFDEAKANYPSEWQ